MYISVSIHVEILMYNVVINIIVLYNFSRFYIWFLNLYNTILCGTITISLSPSEYV